MLNYTFTAPCLDVETTVVISTEPTDETTIVASTEQTDEEEAVATTIVIVGKSGSGKSTLGNKLLNINRGPEDEYEMYFKEGGGTDSVTDQCTSRTSQDTTLMVIDTPGIPDPSNTKTIEYFDKFVMNMRKLRAVNMLKFLVHEDRTNERDFEHFRVLLKQINYIPCPKLMVCRQSVYAHSSPTTKTRDKKRISGMSMVNQILTKSNMVMQSMLLLDGTGKEAEDGLSSLIAITSRCPRQVLGGCSFLRTFEEHRSYVERLSSEKDRRYALTEKLQALANAMTWQERRQNLTVFGAVVTVDVALLSLMVTGAVPVVSGDLVNFVIGPALSSALKVYVFDKQQVLNDEMASIRQELDSNVVDEDSLLSSKQDLAELDDLAA